LQEALRKMPAFPEAELGWGIALVRQGRTDEAIAHYRKAIEVRPQSERSHYLLANALLSKGERAEALAEYETAVRINTRFPLALNDLAWLLATDPEAGRRDGARSVTLAERACELTRYEDPLLIGTLAAAYAEASRFSEAVET